MVIRTRGSQSTSSLHSQCRLPSSPGSAARMFTTMSRSVNSKRWGTSASRSLGPMSGSSSIIEKIWSMTARNSSRDSNSAPIAQEELLVPPPLDFGLARDELGERVVPVERVLVPVDLARVLDDFVPADLARVLAVFARAPLER